MLSDSDLDVRSKELLSSKISHNRVPARRTRNDPEKEKRHLALSSESCWMTTGVPMVESKNGSNGKGYFYLRLSKYKKLRAKCL